MTKQNKATVTAGTVFGYKLIPIQKKIKNPKKALSQSNFWQMKPGRERKLTG